MFFCPCDAPTGDSSYSCEGDWLHCGDPRCSYPLCLAWNANIPMCRWRCNFCGHFALRPCSRVAWGSCNSHDCYSLPLHEPMAYSLSWHLVSHSPCCPRPPYCNLSIIHANKYRCWLGRRVAALAAAHDARAAAPPSAPVAPLAPVPPPASAPDSPPPARIYYASVRAAQPVKPRLPHGTRGARRCPHPPTPSPHQPPKDRLTFVFCADGSCCDRRCGHPSCIAELASAASTAVAEWSPPPLLLRPALVLSAFALLLLHALGTSGRPGTRSGKRLCLRSRPHLSPLPHHHHHPPHRTHVHTRLSMPLGPYARAHLLQCGRPSIQTLSPLTGILLCAFPVANTKIVTPPTARLSLHLHRTRHRQHLLLPTISGSTQSSHRSSPPPVPSQPLFTRPGPRTRTKPGLFLHLHLHHLPLLTRSPSSQGTWHIHQHLLLRPSQLLLHLHLPWLHLLLLLPSCLFCRPLLLPHVYCRLLLWPGFSQAKLFLSCVLPPVVMALLLSSETLLCTLVPFFSRSPQGCQVSLVVSVVVPFALSFVL